MFETIIIPILTLLLGGGIATVITFKAAKKKANAEASQAEIQARTEEFHLLREQVELNQQQNLDLTKANLELVAQIKDKTKRYTEQTVILRETQAKLIASEEDKIKLTERIGELSVELAEKKCEDLPCPFRLPPNAHTPLAKGETKEAYAKRTRSKSAKKKTSENDKA